MVKKLHSFRCEDQLWEAIAAKAVELGVSVNEAMEELISGALGISGSKPTSQVIAQPIAALEIRVAALEKAIAVTDVKPIAQPRKPKPKPIVKAIAQPIASDPDGWLTTGDAYVLMKERHGYTTSLTTFRRHLKQAQEKREIGLELKRGGISELNFEVRAAANPKSNAVRWIWVD